MKTKSLVLFLTVVMLMVLVVAAAYADVGSPTRLIPSGGTTRITGSELAEVDGIQLPELRPRRIESGVEASHLAFHPENDDHKKVRGLFPKAPLDPPKVKSSTVATSNHEIKLSFDGLNHRDQRLANGGNQFSVEPPDQALCAGNGYVVEAVNSVIRVWDTAGNPLTGVQDLNTFFGYPAAINRSTFDFGPQVIDPVCYFDPDNVRFIVVVTTLDSDTAGNYNGRNTIDVAVSNTSDPTGAWTVYYIPAHNDGTEGTPNHGCTLDGVTPGPCFQDYPHIGGDKYGVYISTNEYDLFGPAYNAAQVYAISKKTLATAPAVLPVTLVENLELAGTPGWTVWPAISPIGEAEIDNNGTEYFLSTIAGDGSETGNPTGTARYIGLWALTNTRSLDTATPALTMSSRAIKSQTYVYPPLSDQKPGNIPLGDCINNTTSPTIFGPGCWQLFFFGEPAHDEVESQPDSGDSRMQQVWYVNEMLWGSSGTGVNVNKEIKAGIAWFAVDPEVNRHGKLEGKVKKQGYLALENNNLTYPSIAMTKNGNGVIAFTVLGEDYYPSAGYVTINSKGKVGPIHIAAVGLGPDDGFTSYKAFVGDPPRTRWGDYGAAVTDGKNIWIASEYVAQTCSYEQYYIDPPSLAGFGSCGGTRTSLANWSTRISKIKP